MHAKDLSVYVDTAYRLRCARLSLTPGLNTTEVNPASEKAHRVMSKNARRLSLDSARAVTSVSRLHPLRFTLRSAGHESHSVATESSVTCAQGGGGGGVILTYTYTDVSTHTHARYIRREY